MMETCQLPDAPSMSPRTVGAMRSRAPGGVLRLTVRVGRDGRSRPLDSAKGRRATGEFLSAHPDASLLYGPSRYWYSWTQAPEDRERDLVVRPGGEVGVVAEPPALLMQMRPPGVTPTTPPSSA